MKSIKIILFSGFVFLFTSTHYGVAIAKDCSDLGFHAKIICKREAKSAEAARLEGTSQKGTLNDIINNLVLSGKDAKADKSKVNSFFRKLKNYGGKKVGEAD